MRLLDLFSGIGGFSLAATWAFGNDLEIISFCEIDEFCKKVLKKHWPHVPIVDDIKKINPEQYIGKIDLITAGFPCQDVSVAGGAKRKGLKGKNTGLWYELERVISIIKPAWIVFENVPGLLSSNGGADMAQIVKSLSEIGYCVGWLILDARYFGVAQRRRRVWIIGSFRNFSVAKVLAILQGNKGNDRKVKEVGERGLCITTRTGERYDPTAETFIAYTIGATIRGNTNFLWQDTYIAEINPKREREADGFSRRMDSIRGKALGNAIVPKVATRIFQAIKQVEQGC